jgi:acyl-CoA thioesterase I
MKTLKIFALILLFLLAGCGGQTQSCNIAPLPTNTIILAAGDSLTYGFGAPETKSYPTILQQLTHRKVINAGYPGIGSAKLLQYLPGLLAKHQPNLVILCIGGNDLLNRKDRSQIYRNIEKMIRLIQAQNISILLISVPKPGFFIKPAPFYQELAKKYNIPIENKLLTELETNNKYKADSIHLNAQGYQKLAEGIASLLYRCGAL